MNVVAKPDPKEIALSKPEGRGDRSGLACLVIVARHRGVHLSVPQLVHDNVLTGEHVSADQVLKCARSARPQGQASSSDLGRA